MPGAFKVNGTQNKGSVDPGLHNFQLAHIKNLINYLCAMTSSNQRGLCQSRQGTTALLQAPIMKIPDEYTRRYRDGSSEEGLVKIPS